MDQDDLLQLAAETLERLNLQYAVTGSMASVMFGEPRFTNDIDIVVNLPPKRIRDFCAQFPEADFYLSEDAVREAIRSQSMFNAIHPESGLKIDFILAKDTPFGRLQLERRRRVAIRREGSSEAWFCSPEDVIVNKMLFYREGGSDKHLRDIAGIIKTTADQLDVGYVEDWAARLGVMDIWRDIQQRVSGS